MRKLEIPPKPDSVFWTDDQWKAMTAEGRDILVAAAAGSGKTAVLVERIIRKITTTSHPLDVDELLVVTFTNAAAAEMRHRIGEALQQAINANPESHHLRKQLSLLNRASISTLHSFCQEVIRRFYYFIDVDPGFRVADGVEAQLLRDEALDDLFEEEYGKPDNEPFFAVVDSFTSDRNDDQLQEIILELYDFAQSNPNPNEWLDSIVSLYEVEESMSIEQLPFMESVFYEIDLYLERAKQLVEAAYEITQLPGGPAPRAETYQEDLHIINGLIAARQNGWTALHEAMQLVKFPRAKSCRRADYDGELLDAAAGLRDKGKKVITDSLGGYFTRKAENLLLDMQKMKAHMHTIVYLVKAFSKRFTEMKKEKGLADFSDLEHYCLNILITKDEQGNECASEAALAYQKRFKEILVDEYQDTNRVQETIIQLVTNSEEQSGNLFMVGDVKQSIYRFRLAEPTLFLDKYDRFGHAGEQQGLKIDLAQNFRSRKEVLEGTNFIFQQIMDPYIGEIAYDEAAKLRVGATYPEEPFPIELLLIDQGEGEHNTASRDDNVDSEDSEEFDQEELEQAQLEARIIAQQIKTAIAERRPVYHPKTKTSSPLMYRDIVILLRSMTWAPEIMEELKRQGIPVYADLSSGYFEATEVSIVLSLLKVIDNPLQDIPLAAVLRSPIVQLNEEELSLLRMNWKQGSFYEALQAYIEEKRVDDKDDMYVKVKSFMNKLQQWRTMARQGALSELIWHLYRETRFYDYVGGLPGGKQRQANLNALYDRARQYEATTFRGLFRFLRFIERMRDRGDDLGEARALSEQEDVVRMMTIHKSKGLEFPVVFVAGLGRKFNFKDLQGQYLLDKEFGLATKFVDLEKRISLKSLPQLAFKAKKRREMIAEEMRVLYVALTRAKEKLYLTATLKDLEKERQNWLRELDNPDWLLNQYDRLVAKRYLDWIGPALVRHEDCEALNDGNMKMLPSEIIQHPSCWHVSVRKAEQLLEEKIDETQPFEQLFEKIKQQQPVPTSSHYAEQVDAQLGWEYPFHAAVSHRSKQSVTEIKRLHELAGEDSGTDLIVKARKPLVSRPKFMQEKSLTPAERGTAMHTVMQHIPFAMEMTEQNISSFLKEMVEREILTVEQQGVIDVEMVLDFFASPVGIRLQQAKEIKREVPFSFALPANEVYPDWKGANEPVLIQGMIDCLFTDDAGTVLLDYKTDRITSRFRGGFAEARPILEERYRVQINLYARAAEEILNITIDDKILYFFDGARVIEM